MSIGSVSVAAVAVFLSSMIAARVALYFLRRRQILDVPNERSSHSTPVPRGLGMGVIPVVLIAWLLAAGRTPFPNEVRWLCAGALVLSALSWIDDLREVHAGFRFLAQLLVTGFGVVFLQPPEGLLQLGVPLFVFRAVMVVIWVGLINQVNFTDGIDGNLGTFLVCVGVGLFAAARAGTTGMQGLDVLALFLAAAAAGFLVWNWHPARGFMGDVGSIPLGFLLAWLLLRTAVAGQWEIALILPLLYFFDTLVTYSKRIVRVGVNLWRPHREYMYQQATRFRTHSRIVSGIAVCNLVLIFLAIAAARGYSWLALAAAVVIVAIAYAWLSRGILWGVAPDRSLER